jgi:hypothetical protein
MSDETTLPKETELSIGVSAIEAYSRLSYTMWHAFAEFIDNSTQSRTNHDKIIETILKDEGKTLIVEIVHDRVHKTITISDNSIGMSVEDLIAALKIAKPTKHSKGRSKYGMGLKTSACWIGAKWSVTTCEWASGQEWTATVDVKAVSAGLANIPLTMKKVSTNEHYTRIEISDLHRVIRTSTEETIKAYLGSMYQFDLRSGFLKIIYNGTDVLPPDGYEFATDPSGTPMKADIPETTINGKSVRGWFGILKRGGRKYGGFSLFQNKRQIQGFPNAWKPRVIFGGVDDEGANNLVSQRLTGLIELDGFKVSHTKDAILFEDNEEDQLEDLLVNLTRAYKAFALKRSRPNPAEWTKQKFEELLVDAKKEFESPEMGDAVTTTMLPPITTIIENNAKQVSSLTAEDSIGSVAVSKELIVKMWLKDVSEFEPYVTIAADAVPGSIHVIINRLHPYFSSVDEARREECLLQFIYDAVSEYRVATLFANIDPSAVRRFKDSLLRVRSIKIENQEQAAEVAEIAALKAAVNEGVK